MSLQNIPGCVLLPVPGWKYSVTAESEEEGLSHFHSGISCAPLRGGHLVQIMLCPPFARQSKACYRSSQQTLFLLTWAGLSKPGIQNVFHRRRWLLVTVCQAPKRNIPDMHPERLWGLCLLPEIGVSSGSQHRALSLPSQILMVRQVLEQGTVGWVW